MLGRAMRFDKTFDARLESPPGRPAPLADLLPANLDHQKPSGQSPTSLSTIPCTHASSLNLVFSLSSATIHHIHLFSPNKSRIPTQHVQLADLRLRRRRPANAAVVAPQDEAQKLVCRRRRRWPVELSRLC